MFRCKDDCVIKIIKETIMADELKARLTNLAPAARARVEEALGKVIDAELSAGTLTNVNATEKEFSKGVFFSRSRPSSLMGRLEDSQILEKASTMDDQAFSKFADRLSSLKNIKG
jgi:hypothetical protein